MAMAGRLAALAVPIALITLLVVGSDMARPAAARGAPIGFTGVQVEQPFEETLGTFTKNRLREVRRLLRRMYATVSRSMGKWMRWFRRALPFLLIAILAALADRNLLESWRREGLRVLVTNVPMMLYVYARLLFSSQVRIAGKLFLLLAMIYAVKRRDLIPDRTVVPGFIEDAVLIIVATRTFLSTCPETLVSQFAQEALKWRTRVLTLQRQRQ